MAISAFLLSQNLSPHISITFPATLKVKPAWKKLLTSPFPTYNTMYLKEKKRIQRRKKQEARAFIPSEFTEIKV